MKFTSLLSTILLAVSLSNAAPHLARRDVDPNLVPQFGVNRGVNPTGTGDCDGINGKKIPCACPPDRNDFIKAVSANAAAGHAVNNPGVATPFPTDNSQQSAITRMQTAIVTLQNLNGPGKGCPAVSTTFSAQLDALIKGQAPPAAAPPPAAPAPPPPPPAAPAPPSGGVDPNLVPQFGVQRGVNPTGTGDCDGINGKKIPCACPPDRNDFINAVSANAAAGHAVNNPGVATPFPTDNSQQSAITRMQTAIVTLQNLNGPGKGCPAVSTTFSAQLDALIKGQAPPAAAPPPAAPAPPPPPPAAPAPPSGGVDPNLVPQFGVQRGVNPTGTGDCDGINGKKIPCACPPDRNDFINAVSANAAAGHAVNNPGIATPFPTDNSQQSAIIRMQTAIVTLQNLNGPGKGCPAVSTTFSAQLDALIKGQPAPAPPPPAAPAPPPPPPAAPPAAPPASNGGGVDPNLVPQFGFQAGLNPTGTGDCDGINGVKIPCSCPPDRDAFIKAVSANAAAGHAVNNPGVATPFPTDNSKQSQITRLQTAIVTLQNLNGPGKGCPAVSTTFSAQLKALTG